MDTSELRVARHAALGDPARLAIVDELARSDRAPVELGRVLGLASNLLAHHLDVLEAVGLVERRRSSGDGRRRYVRLVRSALHELVPAGHLRPTRALFVCTRNSARSPLAAAVWHAVTGVRAESAGTHPAERVHPGAVAAAARAGLDLGDVTPRPLSAVRSLPPLVVTVCDQAHEELTADPTWLHWSLPDPAADGHRRAFDRTVEELRRRITDLVAPEARP